jgi:hypothetical protein
MELNGIFMAAGKKTCGGACDKYNEGVCLGLCLAGDEYVDNYVKKRELEEKNNPTVEGEIKVLQKRDMTIPEVNRRDVSQDESFDIKFTI